MAFLPTFLIFVFFFFNDTATTEIYTLSLHDALPIHRAAFAHVPAALVLVPVVHHELQPVAVPTHDQPPGDQRVDVPLHHRRVLLRPVRRPTPRRNVGRIRAARVRPVRRRIRPHRDGPGRADGRLLGRPAHVVRRDRGRIQV